MDRAPWGTMREPDPYRLIELGLLDTRADGHLRNWAEWTLSYRGGCRGYDSRSSVVRSPSSSSVDDMLDRMDANNARICDSIIDDLDAIHQGVIQNVYIADVWRMRPGIDPVRLFLEAVGRFWREAARRGLS